MYCGLRKIDWKPLYQIHDSTEASNHFQEKVYEVMLKTVPQKKTSSTFRYPVWFTKEIIKCIRKKEKCRQKLKKEGNDFKLREKYGMLRASSKKLIRKSYREYVENVEKEMKSEPQKFWKYVNTKRKDNSAATTLQYGEKNYSENGDIANVFAEYFSSVYSSKYLNAQNTSHKKEVSNDNMIVIKSLTQSDVEAAMRELKPKRGMGPDGIPPYVYKACREILVAPLTHVYGIILETKQYPRSWTISKVTPIPKGNATQDVMNYRPIAIPPVPAKIFESTMFRKLHISANST
jgi:hypothetical protein